MTETAQVKVSRETLRLVRLGATMNDCTMTAFVDEAIEQYLANHAAEVESGLTHAQVMLRV